MGIRKRRRDSEGEYLPTPPIPSTSAGSSSSNPILLDTPPKSPPSKKQKAKKDSHVPQPEKRGAIFKKACPKNILERVERVMSQRFFMVDRTRKEDELREEFSVLGSTGNVYKVVIDKKPSCNCPDATKGNHCKHILFVFLKVLQVTHASGLWYQKALLTSELETIFSEAPLAPNAVAHPRVRQAYAQATGKASASKAAANTAEKKRRIPGPDDDCPICYEGMHGAAETSLAFCADCGNALHSECFRQWASTAAKKGEQLTCVWCRAKWGGPAGAGVGAGSGAGRMSEGYVNLGDVAGVSPVRDTSSYYHGPRRGQRDYGYRDYGGGY